MVIFPYRFYRACSLSEILGQLKVGQQKTDTGSLSGSVDMLVDVGNRQTDIQDTLTVSISAESIKLDSNSKILLSRSIPVTEQLAFLTSDHKILGLNPTRSGVQLMDVLHFIAQSFNITPSSS